MALAQVPGAVAGPEFDAASVKVVDRSTLTGRGDGGRSSGGPGTSDPGRFSYPAATMLGLLMTAFGAERGQIVGAAVQPSTNANFYEVTATMPLDTTQTQFQAMLQNLLAERFHLVAHHETRTFPAYELVVDKGGSKLKEATPQSDDGPPKANARGDFQNRSEGHITMKAQTMEEFARRLGMAVWTAEAVQTKVMNAPVPRVVDRTGLTGKYTFSLDFSPPGIVAGPDDAAADLPELFVALRRKLGLRLEKTAGVPVDVIVVDSVDKAPVEN